MRRLGLVGLVCLVAMAALTAVSAPAQAFTVICTGKTKAQVARCDTSGYAAVMKKMHWRMYGGHNCTNYAAYRMQQLGVPEPRILLGNARDWHKNAKKLGYTVNQVPSVGAIGQWSKASSHVAYVEEVGDGYLILSEDSYTSKTYRRYKVLTGASWYPERFIHFVTPGTVTPAPVPAPAPTPAAKVKASVSVTAPAKVSKRIKATVTVRVTAAKGVVPEGRVRVRRGGATVATAQLTAASNGTAKVTIPRMKRGKQWISAVFDGSAAVKPATSKTVKVTVTKPPKVVSSTTTVTVPAQVADGARPVVPVVVKSKDGRAMTNKVSVYVDGKRIAAPKLTKKKKGRVNVRLPRLAPGDHTIRATYWGSKPVRRSLSKTTRFVVVESTSVTASLVQSTVGSAGAATVSATVRTRRGAAPATGAVEVLVDGTRVAAASLAAADRGTVSIPVTGLAPGVRRVSVRYAGSTHQAPSESPAHQLTVLEPSVSAFSKGPKKRTVTTEAKFDVTVHARSGAPATSGRVAIMHGTKVLAEREITPALDGTVRLVLPRLTPNTYQLKVSFSGNALLEPSVSDAWALEITK